ncbi:hypothetical protein ABPG74_019096 [Tetrahymena malaccensis]
MFSDFNMYEAKVFLRAVADAQNTFRQSAQQKNLLARYESQSQSLLDGSISGAISITGDNIQQGRNFKALKEVKLFQYSNEIFKKYLAGFDSFSGDYAAFKKFLNDSVKKIELDA